MQDPSRPVRRFATVLQGGGAIALACGVAALAWPDGMLLRAMLLTALVLAASGVYEMGFAWHNRHLNRGWPLALGDGTACFGMAAISVTMTAIPFRATMLLAAAWLSGCGVLAAFALFDRNAELVTLLYVGAAYTIGFGIFQIVAAQWMRRVAIPQFEPTQQYRWLATAAR